MKNKMKGYATYLFLVELGCFHLIFHHARACTHTHTHARTHARTHTHVIRIQAQQKYRRRNTHSFAQCIYSPWKKQIHLSEVSYSTFLLPSIPYKHNSWHGNFWSSTLTQDWFSGLLTFLSTVLKQFATKLHSRPHALFPSVLYKALSYFLFLLHSIQMTAQALTQRQS